MFCVLDSASELIQFHCKYLHACKCYISGNILNSTFHCTRMHAVMDAILVFCMLYWFSARYTAGMMHAVMVYLLHGILVNCIAILVYAKIYS